jgi:hypothetical protein
MGAICLWSTLESGRSSKAGLITPTQLLYGLDKTGLFQTNNDRE